MVKVEEELKNSVFCPWWVTKHEFWIFERFTNLRYVMLSVNLSVNRKLNNLDNQYKCLSHLLSHKWQTFTDSSLSNVGIFSAVCDCKFNIFGFWAAGWTKQGIWRCHLGLWERVKVFFSLSSGILQVKLIGDLKNIINILIDNENNCWFQP